MSDIKAELRLIREKCPTIWRSIIDSFCPKDFKLNPINENCIKANACKDCWDKAIESECES